MSSGKVKLTSVQRERVLIDANTNVLFFPYDISLLNVQDIFFVKLVNNCSLPPPWYHLHPHLQTLKRK